MSSTSSSPDRHVVVSASQVGRHVAAQLAARGSHVTVVTRSGRDTGLRPASRTSRSTRPTPTR